MTRILFVFCFLLSSILSHAAHAEFEENASTAAVDVNQHSETAKQDELDTVKARQRHNQASRGERRIYPVNMRPDAIYRLQTALSYTSTIDLPEPALKVFIGDQDLFKVGVYEKQVVIKPITDDPAARTNLTVVTADSRLTFDVTVGAPETADFVLDFRLPADDVLVENAFEEKVKDAEEKVKQAYEQKEQALDKRAEEISDEKLKDKIKEGNQAVMLKDSAEAGEITLQLLSMSTIGDQGYLRFAIRNASDRPYAIREIVLGAQTYEKKSFGLKKERDGIVELKSELKITNPIPSNTYEYGVLQFERHSLKKGETPVLLLFEDGGERNIRLEGFRWLN